MQPCTTPIDCILCPCRGYEASLKRDICDVCGHLSSHHDSSPIVAPLSMPTAISSSSGRPHSVTSLFQHLLKSTPSGTIALQETSNGLQKQQVVSPVTYDHEHSVIDGTLTSRTGTLTDGAAGYAGGKPVHEGTRPLPVSFCCFHYMRPRGGQGGKSLFFHSLAEKTLLPMMHHSPR
jgi:hypothetical protein